MSGATPEAKPTNVETTDKPKEAQSQGPVLGETTLAALDAADSAHKIDKQISALDEAGKARTNEKVAGAVKTHNDQIHEVNTATTTLTQNDTTWLNGKGYEVSGTTPPVLPDLPTDAAKLPNAIGMQAASLVARETVATGYSDAGRSQKQFSKNRRSNN